MVFLIIKYGHYWQILRKYNKYISPFQHRSQQETSISISDRVAFACQYLGDDKLAEYVNQLIVECHETGSLSGLLLTGATPAAIPLIQRFLDWNEDVQTAALVAVRFLPTELVFDDQVQSWIDR